MKLDKRSIVVALLFSTLGAAGATTTVTIHPSSIGFKQALAACPSGTLGSISLSLGHLRVSEAPGVDVDIDAGNPSAQQVLFSIGSKNALATVNAYKNTIAAKHVTVASANRVACVAPD
jgi:hypothetical protein